MLIQSFDERRDLFIGKTKEEFLDFAAHHWAKLAKKSIQEKGSFTVALSGGNTPKQIYQKICSSPIKDSIDFSKVFLFFSDERAYPLDHKENNYHMAMEAGFKDLTIPSDHIFPMRAEKDIEKNALQYEENLKKFFPLDLVMLGVGEDGHIASLFPNSKEEKKDNLVIVTKNPKNQMRMSLTFHCINQSKAICLYVLGSSKKQIVKQVLLEKDPALPASHIGTFSHKAVWMMDEEAFEKISKE